jgi:hypothetical protein
VDASTVDPAEQINRTKPNRPKHRAEMTRAEVNQGLINRTKAGNIIYSPNDCDQ